VVKNDVKEISDSLQDKINDLAGQTLLIAGGAGFLGYYLIHTLLYINDNILEKPCKVICLDNFIRGTHLWLYNLKNRSDIKIIKADVTSFDYKEIEKIDYIIYAASIASPTFYRKYPIETMDVNVNGLRNLLNYCKKIRSTEKAIKSFLFFSSSEIYGDPSPDAIPTPEEYRGFVSCTGPRACYCESKRYGETTCVNFHKVYNIPVKIARPFNNYGPGLNINDRRVIPDFCKNVLKRENIKMFSDGSQTRTFCYVSDAITGYLLMLLSYYNGEAFNIGTESPEIPIKDLANIIIQIGEELFKIKNVKVIRQSSDDKEYLIDSPKRRCPSISKAKKLLGYTPKVKLEDGLRRTLTWYNETM
jgi:dTDP-glucose 4,6-dehydratase/UDP-glucuronate decarboxylase